MKDIIQPTQSLNDYYRNQFLNCSRSALDGDHTMTFIVKDDTDLMLFAEAARQVWEADGGYPHSFKGLVKTTEGNCFATFDYTGAIDAHNALSA